MLQIILVVVGIMIVVILLSRKSREKVAGICANVIGRDAKKEERKGQILELLSQKSEISNSDIREALGVSDRTAVRYMDELEKEGTVEQVGDIGHAVTYRLK